MGDAARCCTWPHSMHGHPVVIAAGVGLLLWWATPNPRQSRPPCWLTKTCWIPPSPHFTAVQRIEGRHRCLGPVLLVLLLPKQSKHTLLLLLPTIRALIVRVSFLLAQLPAPRSTWRTSRTWQVRPSTQTHSSLHRILASSANSSSCTRLARSSSRMFFVVRAVSTRLVTEVSATTSGPRAMVGDRHLAPLLLATGQCMPDDYLAGVHESWRTAKAESRSAARHVGIGPAVGVFLLHLPLRLLSRLQASGDCACASCNRPACRLLTASSSQLVTSSGSAPMPGGSLSVPVVPSTME